MYVQYEEKSEEKRFCEFDFDPYVICVHNQRIITARSVVFELIFFLFLNHHSVQISGKSL